MPVMNNATILYCKVQQPTLCFESVDRKEYTVDVCVTKEQAKAWSKKYPKQKHKEFDNADFTKIFKIAPPHPEQDEQFVIKFKKKADYIKDGVLTQIPDAYKPRVIVKGEDGKLEDITATKLVSNGSTGAIQFDETTNKFGTFAQLKAIRVDHLIEYKSAGADYDELGEVGELQDLSTVETKAAKVEPESKGSDNFDDDIPF